MRIAVISRGPEIHSTARLLEAGAARGHDMYLIPILESVVIIEGGETRIEVGGERIPEPDAIIPRIGTFLPEFAQALLTTLERKGKPQVNRFSAIDTCRNKFESLGQLAERGLPVPRTIYVKDLDQIQPVVESFGEGPVVIKPVVGTQGRGVIRADSVVSAASTLEAMVLLSREVLVQEYLQGADGSDFRLVVLGDEVLASVRRTAKNGGFRSNWHQGAELELFQAPEKLCRLAVTATQALGLDFAGVDLVETGGGPQILEVNSSPGFQGTERATGIDVATKLIEFLER